MSALFIRRPVMTTLTMLALVIFGAMAYRELPVSDLPSVDLPTIQVSAMLPGASPDVMASSVATPLERQFSTIAGLDNMSSTSTRGSTSITLQFVLDRDVDAAAQDVQAAIALASRSLPADMPSPPSYRKVNPASQPILYLALSSATLPLSAVNEYADTVVAQRLSTVLGVAQVQIFGAQKYAVRIRLDPRLLATRGIGLDEIQTALQQANPNLPTGSLQGPSRAFTVETTGDFTQAAHLLYRGVLERLAANEQIRLHPSKTSGDYARELLRKGSRAHGEFRQFGRRYDHVLFAIGSCDAETYRILRDHAQRVVQLLERRERAA